MASIKGGIIDLYWLVGGDLTVDGAWGGTGL